MYKLWVEIEPVFLLNCLNLGLKETHGCIYLNYSCYLLIVTRLGLRETRGLLIVLLLTHELLLDSKISILCILHYSTLGGGTLMYTILKTSIVRMKCEVILLIAMSGIIDSIYSVLDLEMISISVASSLLCTLILEPYSKMYYG